MSDTAGAEPGGGAVVEIHGRIGETRVGIVVKTTTTPGVAIVGWRMRIIVVAVFSVSIQLGEERETLNCVNPRRWRCRRGVAPVKWNTGCSGYTRWRS